jgi:isopentenyldiphosphate isomerase
MGIKMEIWDLYDKDGNKLNKTHTRGMPLNKDEYHIAVDIWIKNNKDQILLTQRHPSKLYPMKWECTCGAVISGEDSFNGALREVEEEIGIKLDPNEGKKILRIVRDNTFFDVHLFKKDIETGRTKLQETEVINIKWVTKDELKRMFENGEMVGPLNYVMKLIEERII